MDSGSATSPVHAQRCVDYLEYHHYAGATSPFNLSGEVNGVHLNNAFVFNGAAVMMGLDPDAGFLTRMGSSIFPLATAEMSGVPSVVGMHGAEFRTYRTNGESYQLWDIDFIWTPVIRLLSGEPTSSVVHMITDEPGYVRYDGGIVDSAPLSTEPSVITNVGDIVYLANGSTITVLDSASPITELLVIDVGSTVTDMDPLGDYLFVSHESESLDVVDISTPTKPFVIGQWPTSEGARLDAHNGVVYTSGRVYGRSWAVTDPLNPVMISQFQSGDEVVAGDSWVATYDDYYLDRRIHVSTSGSPPVPVIHQLPLPETNTVRGSGDVLSVYDGAGFVLFDISNFDLPVRRGSYESIDWSTDGYHAWANDHLLVAGNGQLQVVSAADLDNPTLVGSVAIPNDWPRPATVQENLVFVSTYDTIDGDHRLAIVDVTSPSAPVLLSATVPANGTVAVAGDRLFAGFGDLVNEWNLSDPTAPILVRSESLPDVVSVTLVGDALFARAQDCSFECDTPSYHVFDISAGLSWVEERGGIGFPITPISDTIAVTPRAGPAGTGTSVLDVTDPFNPLRLGGPGGYIWAGPSRLYAVANRELRVHALPCRSSIDVPDVSSSATGHVVTHPNPMRTFGRFSMPHTETTTVAWELFDVLGRRVRALTSTGTDLTWDLRDESGKPVVSGRYFVRGSANGRELGTAAISVVR